MNLNLAVSAESGSRGETDFASKRLKVDRQIRPGPTCGEIRPDVECYRVVVVVQLEEGCCPAPDPADNRVVVAKPKLTIEWCVSAASVRVLIEEVAGRRVIARNQQRLGVHLKAGIVGVREQKQRLGVRYFRLRGPRTSKRRPRH